MKTELIPEVTEMILPAQCNRKITLFENDFLLDKFNNLRLVGLNHDTLSVKVLLENIGSEFVVLDVGAFIGYYSVILANSVKEVHCFEPYPESYELLSMNLAPYSNVVLNNVGVGKDSGTRNCFFDPKFTADNRLLPVSGRSSIKVNTIDLDSYPTRVDFIKIDAQGSEGEILLGAKNTLTKYKPRMIVEFAPYILKDSEVPARQLLDLLTKFNYTLFNIDQGKKKVYQITPEELLRGYKDSVRIHTDILCV